MKKFILPFIFSCVLLKGQQPAIHSPTVLPTNPGSSQPIKIATHISTPNSSFQVDKFHQVSTSPSGIKLHLCYADGMATVITHHVDTFAVGVLSPGVYPVQLSAYMSSAGQHCARVDSNFSAFTLTVTNEVGLKKESNPTIFRIYPNPSTGYVSLMPAGEYRVRIFSAHGQMLKTMENISQEFSTREMSKGIYYIEVTSAAAREVQRLVIE